MATLEEEINDLRLKVKNNSDRSGHSCKPDLDMIDRIPSAIDRARSFIEKATVKGFGMKVFRAKKYYYTAVGNVYVHPTIRVSDGDKNLLVRNIETSFASFPDTLPLLIHTLIDFGAYERSCTVIYPHNLPKRICTVMNHFIFLDLKEKWETLSKKAASIGDEIMLNAKETVAEWLKHNSGESERKKFKNKAFNALNRYEGLVDMDFSSFCKIMRMNPECVEALARFGNANLGYVDIVQESDFLEIQNLLKINSVLKR